MKQVTRLITGSSIAFFLHTLLDDKCQLAYIIIFLPSCFWAVWLYENLYKINFCGLNSDVTPFLYGST